MPFNRLTPGEAERLALLAEECGEVVQVIGKILRHGYESCHPNGGDSNRVLLERELGDLLAAKELMCSEFARGEDLSAACIDSFRDQKLKRVRQYLHHNAGRLEYALRRLGLEE